MRIGRRKYVCRLGFSCSGPSCFVWFDLFFFSSCCWSGFHLECCHELPTFPPPLFLRPSKLCNIQLVCAIGDVLVPGGYGPRLFFSDAPDDVEKNKRAAWAVLVSARGVLFDDSSMMSFVCSQTGYCFVIIAVVGGRRCVRRVSYQSVRGGCYYCRLFSVAIHFDFQSKRGWGNK